MIFTLLPAISGGDTDFILQHVCTLRNLFLKQHFNFFFSVEVYYYTLGPVYVNITHLYLILLINIVWSFSYLNSIFANNPSNWYFLEISETTFSSLLWLGFIESSFLCQPKARTTLTLLMLAAVAAGMTTLNVSSNTLTCEWTH